MKTAIVINAGGTGTRLWPLSTKDFPKQFVSLVNDKSLIRNTFDRVCQQYGSEDIFITTTTKFKDVVLREIPELSENNLILEPKKMDTAPAIALMTFKMKDKGYDTVISIHCDHNITDVDEFLRILRVAEEINQKHTDKLLLIGMSPNYPATGFGYIEMGSPVDRFNKDLVFTVDSFKEKPDKKTAERFLADWKYLWNAGYFIFNPTFLLEQYQKYASQTYDALKDTYDLDPFSSEFAEAYGSCDPIAFDYAITEKLHEIFVLPASVGWSDIGSWKAVKEIINDYDLEKNVYSANVVDVDTKGSVIYSKNKDKVIAVLGLEDVVVIDSDDVLLVTTIERCEDVKKLVEKAPDELK